MFEPLKRGLHATPANRWEGSLGLGLYIAREVARAHGGEIHARCEGDETVFSVRLPRGA
jgi:signal transduction histidine kinase